MDTLEGCHILFSSVIPLDTRPEVTEIWKTAHAFGAKCYTELSGRITHVVAAKVIFARSYPELSFLVLIFYLIAWHPESGRGPANGYCEDCLAVLVHRLGCLMGSTR